MTTLKISFLLCVIILGSICHAQTNHLNCTVFIDGKLPDLDVLTGYFNYIDSNKHLTKIDFDYVIGEITLSNSDYYLLKKAETNSDIEICFKYKPAIGKEYQYFETLKVEWLFDRYLILRITNLDFRRGTYYFGYSCPSITKKFIPKEYYMFPKY